MKQSDNGNENEFKDCAMPVFSRTPLFLGLRYLFRKKLSYLAIIGVMLSVGTLIVVMSVMVGFEKELRSIVRGYLSDITIKPVSGGLARFQNWEQARDDIISMEHVKAVAPYIEGPGLMRIPRYDYMQHVAFKGMDPELESAVTSFGDTFIKNGDLSALDNTYMDDNNARVPACIIGSEMAKQWSIHYQLCQKISKELDGELKEEVLKLMYAIRDAETLDEGQNLLRQAIFKLGSAGEENLASTLSANVKNALRDEIILVTATGDLRRRLKKFVVAGVFHTGRYDYDSGVVLLSLDSAMAFLASDGAVTGLNIKLDNYEFAPVVKNKLNQKYIARTWEDQQHNFLEAVKMEQTLMAIILSFVGMLAGFCIFAILIMTVYEKRRDIGILKALGFASSDVATIFLLNGSAIGVIGAALGAIGGLTFAYHINEIAGVIERWTGWTPFPQDVYYFTEIPADRGIFVPLIIAIAAIMCSLVFSVLPAIKAARMDPVQTLRYE